MLSASSLVAEWVSFSGVRQLMPNPGLQGSIRLMDTLPNTDNVDLLQYKDKNVKWENAVLISIRVSG